MTRKTQHVEVEDHGQDFLNFDLTDEGVIENANLQGWVWNGKKVVNAPLSVGDVVRFEDGALRYRVTAVRES